MATNIDIQGLLNQNSLNQQDAVNAGLLPARLNPAELETLMGSIPKYEVPLDIPNFTRLGDRYARKGGFNPLSREQLQTKTQAEIDAYEEQRRRARGSGILDSIRRMGLAFQGIDPNVADLKRQELELRRMQLQQGKEYKPPSSYQEYTLTDDTPTQEEYKEFLINRKKAGAQIINVGPQGQQFGNPPKDTAWKRNELGEVVIDDRGIPVALPIQGTNLFRQQEKSSGQKEKSGDEVVVTGGVVLGNIDRIRNKIENSVLPTTGIGGQMLRNIGGTAALDVSKLIDPIQASIGFDRLQRMREASPTGGALGQVSERELDLLMATLSSLDQAQSEEQFLESLAGVETRYTNIIRKFNAYPEQAMLEVGYVPQKLNQKEISDNLEIDGYTIKQK